MIRTFRLGRATVIWGFGRVTSPWLGFRTSSGLAGRVTVAWVGPAHLVVVRS